MSFLFRWNTQPAKPTKRRRTAPSSDSEPSEKLKSPIAKQENEEGDPEAPIPKASRKAAAAKNDINGNKKVEKATAPRKKKEKKSGEERKTAEFQCFLQECRKINDNSYKFNIKGVAGVYKPSTDPISHTEVVELLQKKELQLRHCPDALPAYFKGSYIFFVKREAFAKDFCDIERDFLWAWRARDTWPSAWSQHETEEGEMLRSGRWKHPKLDIKRKIAYLQDQNGLPTSAILFHYVFLGEEPIFPLKPLPSKKSASPLKRRSSRRESAPVATMDTATEDGDPPENEAGPSRMKKRLSATIRKSVATELVGDSSAPAPASKEPKPGKINLTGEAASPTCRSRVPVVGSPPPPVNVNAKTAADAEVKVEVENEASELAPLFATPSVGPHEGDGGAKGAEKENKTAADAEVKVEVENEAPENIPVPATPSVGRHEGDRGAKEAEKEGEISGAAEVKVRDETSKQAPVSATPSVGPQEGDGGAKEAENELRRVREFEGQLQKCLADVNEEILHVKNRFMAARNPSEMKKESAKAIEFGNLAELIKERNEEIKEELRKQMGEEAGGEEESIGDLAQKMEKRRQAALKTLNELKQKSPANKAKVEKLEMRADILKKARLELLTTLEVLKCGCQERLQMIREDRGAPAKPKIKQEPSQRAIRGPK